MDRRTLIGGGAAAAVAIGTIVHQDGGTLLQALDPLRVALEQVQGLVLGPF